MSAIPGKAPSLKLPPQIESGRGLLLEELGKLLTVEETLVKLVLPELLSSIDDDELKSVVSGHLEETRGHVGNVQRAFLELGEVPSGRPAYGLDGLRTEHRVLAPQVVPGARGSVHVAAAMAAEHYEINAYEAAIRLADALEARETSVLLRAILEQEIAALEQLGAQADRLGRAAVEQRTV